MPPGNRIRSVETREGVSQIEVTADPNTLNGGAGVEAAAGTLAINPTSLLMYYNADGTPTGWEVFDAGGGGSGESNTGASLGTGADVYKNKIGVTLNFRSLLSASSDTPLSYTELTDEVQLDFDVENLTLASAIVVADKILVKDAGTDTHHYGTVSQLPFTLATDGITDGQNVGSGPASVFKIKSGTTLQFRTLTGTIPIIATETTDDITFSFSLGGVTAIGLPVVGTDVILLQRSTDPVTTATVADLPFVTDGISLGAGTDIYIGEVSSVLQFRTISFETPGPIQWTIISNDIEFQFHITGATAGFPTGDDFLIYESFTDGNNYNADIGEVAAAMPFVGNNLGTGVDVYKNKTGTTLHFRSLLAAASDTPLAYSELTNEILLDFDVENLTLASAVVIADKILVKDAGTDTHHYGTVSQLPFTLASEGVTAATSLGLGADVYKLKSETTLQFRSLTVAASDTPLAYTVLTGEIRLDFSLAYLTLATEILTSDYILVQDIVTGTHHIGTVSQLPFTLASDGITDGTSLGAGVDVYKTKSGTTLQFRSLSVAASGTPLSYGELTDEVRLLFSLGYLTAATEIIAADYILVQDIITGVHHVGTVSQLPFGTGDITDGLSVGTGADVYKLKSGTVLHFKTLSVAASGTPLAYSELTDEARLLFELLYLTVATDIIASDVILVRDSVSGIHHFGTVSQLPFTLAADGVTDGSNVGTGADVYKQKSGTTLQFKTLSVAPSGTPLSYSELTDEARLIFNISSLTVATEILDADLILVKDIITGIHHYGTVSQLPFSGGGTITGAVNIGSGEGVYASPTNSTLQFKSLNEKSSASGTKITSTSTEVQFAVDITGMAATTTLGTDTYFLAERTSVAGTIKKVTWQTIRKNIGLHWTRTSNISLTHDATVSIAWETEIRDTIGLSPATDVTPTTAGVYQLNIMVGMRGLTTDVVAMQIIIYKNGVEFARTRLPAVQATSISRMPMSHAMELDGDTDYLTVKINQVNDSSTTVTVKEAYLTMDLLGAT